MIRSDQRTPGEVRSYHAPERWSKDRLIFAFLGDEKFRDSSRNFYRGVWHMNVEQIVNQFCAERKLSVIELAAKLEGAAK